MSEVRKGHYILGIDEVGRGPWAGPLLMGGVILPLHEEMTAENRWIEELTDSKKCSRSKRERLYLEIKEKAVAAAVGWVSAEELSEIGLGQGLRLACRRVVENVQALGVPFHEIVIDGDQNFLRETRLEKYVTNVVQADLYVKEVSAASIFAKVEHDHYMFRMAERYPQYNFYNNVGYGTKDHIAAIKKYGLTPEHRLYISTLKKMGLVRKDKYGKFVERGKNTTDMGKYAERKVAEWMGKQGHDVMEMNYKTKACEIDIVSSRQGVLYFTEVKYRKNGSHGSGLEAITPTKLKHMRRGAEVFMKEYEYTGPSRLAAAETSGDCSEIKWVEVE